MDITPQIKKQLNDLVEVIEDTHIELAKLEREFESAKKKLVAQMNQHITKLAVLNSMLQNDDTENAKT